MKTGLLQGCYKVVTRLLTSSQPCYKVVAWLIFYTVFVGHKIGQEVRLNHGSMGVGLLDVQCSYRGSYKPGPWTLDWTMPWTGLWTGLKAFEFAELVTGCSEKKRAWGLQFENST